MKQSWYSRPTPPHWIVGAPAPEHFGVILACAMEVDHDALRVLYSLTNRTADTYWVFDRLKGQSSTYDPNMVQINYDYDASTLLLAKQIPAVHELYAHTYNVVPEQSRLEPYGTLGSELRVALPAAVNDYFRLRWTIGDDRAHTLAPITPRRTRRILFSVGIMKADPGAPEVNDVDAVLNQIILSKLVTLDQSIDVLDFGEKPAAPTR
jgi:hypothetical protein